MSDVHSDGLFNDPRMAYGELAIGVSGAGTDIRDQPESDELDSEFRRFESSGPDAVDWKRLNEMSLAIIQTKSKDLRIAARLAYGLYREEGYKGLAVGLAILEGMAANHWEGLFPPVNRERGRAGAFDWLAERLSRHVETDEPDAATNAAIIVAQDKLLALDELLTKKLSKHPAALGPLIRALRPHAQGARTAVEKGQGGTAETAAGLSEAGATATTNAAPATSQGQSKPVAGGEPIQNDTVHPAVDARADVPEISAVSMDAGIEKALQSLCSGALKIAASIRQTNPADLRSYLGTRYALWGQIVKLPSSTAGKTALAPPRKEQRMELELARSATNNQVLLSAAESAFVASPFWLDAQFFAAEAAAGLGADFATVHETIISELRSFLVRLPDLMELTFSDGSPFAAEETRNWIASEVMSSGASHSNGAHSALDDVAGEADKLGQAGEVLHGLKTLSAHQDRCVGEREIFLARLRLAAFCLRFDMLEPVFPLLAEMRAIADLRNLDSWEPALAIELAMLSWRAIDHQGAGQVLDEQQRRARRADIVATLSRLDIVKAAELSAAH
jgi:type VI secretion system protein VasJ